MRMREGDIVDLPRLGSILWFHNGIVPDEELSDSSFRPRWVDRFEQEPIVPPNVFIVLRCRETVDHHFLVEVVLWDGRFGTIWLTPLEVP